MGCSSFADFKGFAVDGEAVPEDTEPVTRRVDVIISDPTQQWVSLECEVTPGSIPTPVIKWNRADTGGANPQVLTEDFVANKVRFVEGGRWLILETTAEAVDGKEYYCEVTNKQIFQTIRSPITYTFHSGKLL